MSTLNQAKLPETREEAQRLGFRRYFSRTPCAHGHVAARYVSTDQCVACQLKHARRHGGWGARPSPREYLTRLRAFVQARGGVLLSEDYISAKTKLKVKCERGHLFEPTADNLKQGRWCPRCKIEKHAKRMVARWQSVEALREFARKRYDGDCLAEKPQPALTRVTWRCRNRNHRPFQATISAVLNGGSWCPACWQERRQPPKPAISIDAAENVVQARGGEILRIGRDGKWIGSKTRLRLRCANRHEWSAEASNILYAGSWCPVCSNKGERIARAIFEITFGAPFPKIRPDWLRSTSGRRLELDGYNETLRIAFEYQGPHHYEDPVIVARDELKRQLCAEHQITLVHVSAVKRPYPATVIVEVVQAGLTAAGLDVKALPPDGNVFSVELRELQELAASRDGTLLSTEYLGDGAHEWKCAISEHPSWFADAWRIRNRGHWCPSCAGNRRLGKAGLQEWGRSVGLELVSDEYCGAASAYEWKCGKCGYKFKRSRADMRRSLRRSLPACPYCRREVVSRQASSVVATNLNTGERTHYPSLKHAAEATGVARASISRISNGRALQAGGYTFEYPKRDQEVAPPRFST